MKRQFSYWELTSGINTFSKNNTSTRPSDLKTDILIVGAGFCGSWLAHFLLKKNPKLNITIVERDFLNLGASTRNAGFLSCGNVSEWLADSKEFSWDETLLTLKARIEGINLIKTELGNQPSFFNCGSVDCDPVTEEKERLIERLNEGLRSMDYDSFFEVRGINYGGKSKSVPFNRFDSEINPCDLLLSLHRSLMKRGVQFVWQTNVETLGKGEAVLKNATETIALQYGYGFLCTNAFARELSQMTNVEPARGQILVTSECTTATTRSLGFLRSGYDYFRFIGRRVLVGGGRLEFKSQENTDILDVTSGLKTYLSQLAEEVIGHSDFTIDYHWSGIMGLRRGKHASISDLKKQVSIDSKTEEVAGFGGWGVTLTPYVAKMRAQNWLNG